MARRREDKHPERVWPGVLAVTLAGLMSIAVALSVSETGRLLCLELWALLRSRFT